MPYISPSQTDITSHMPRTFCICATCAPRLYHLSLTTTKNTTEQECQRRILQNPNKVFIVYLTELSSYLTGHQQPIIPVTHLPNASMMSLQRYFDEAHHHKIPMIHSLVLHHPQQCCTYPTCPYM